MSGVMGGRVMCCFPLFLCVFEHMAVCAGCARDGGG